MGQGQWVGISWVLMGCSLQFFLYVGELLGHVLLHMSSW